MHHKKIYWFLITLLRSLYYGKIGFPSYLARPLYISKANRIFLGKKTRILPNARIEVYKNTGKVVFEGDNSIGQNLHLTCGGDLVIGFGTTIAENVYLSDIEHNLNEINTSVVSRSKKVKKTKIGKYCFIGYGAVILPGTILGNNCIVGANSVIRGEFDDNSMIAGNPGRVIKKFNNSQWEKKEY